MYYYKIKTTGNVVLEGLSSKRDVLDDMLTRKISRENIKGRVEIYDGKKLIDEYDVK